MSKLDEEIRKRFTIRRSDDCEEGIDMQRASDFIDGYRQAEQDNALTWEDIKTIDKLLNQCIDYSNPYQEVLKRFKEMKEK